MIPSTGEDTTKVLIELKYIRSANIKLLERQYLIETGIQKDSIILSYKKYVNEQNIIIDNYKNAISKSNDINNKLSKNLDKQKKLTRVCGTVAGVSILTIVLLVVSN